MSNWTAPILSGKGEKGEGTVGAAAGIAGPADAVKAAASWVSRPLPGLLSRRS